MVIMYVYCVAERSGTGLDSGNDDQHNEHSASACRHCVAVASRLCRTCHPLCCFPRHFRGIPLSRLQTTPSSIRGIIYMLHMQSALCAISDLLIFVQSDLLRCDNIYLI